LETRTIRVDEAGASRTVQSVLHDRGGFTHADARGLIGAGCVLRNGKSVGRVDERCAVGDRIEIAFEAGRKYHAPRRPPRGDGYRVVFEDDDLVIVDKEPGVLTVPAPSVPDDSLLDRLLASYKKRGLRRAQVLAVHRIDRFTSGLVAFARTGKAYAALREQFAAGKPERVYLAFVDGAFPKEKGRLIHRLEENPKSLKVRAVSSGRGARPASCSYRVLERFPHATLLEVSLETGRRNQIRVQFAAEGHALIGDVSYGGPTAVFERTALHAHRLAFAHPTRDARVEVESALPADLTKLAKGLRRGADPAGRQSATRTRTPV
jgi:23S rRNA pseudouridine1911/1915/1917 synthase